MRSAQLSGDVRATWTTFRFIFLLSICAEAFVSLFYVLLPILPAFRQYPATLHTSPWKDYTLNDWHVLDMVLVSRLARFSITHLSFTVHIIIFFWTIPSDSVEAVRSKEMRNNWYNNYNWQIRQFVSNCFEGGVTKVSKPRFARVWCKHREGKYLGHTNARPKHLPGTHENIPP